MYRKRKKKLHTRCIVHVESSTSVTFAAAVQCHQEHGAQRTGQKHRPVQYMRIYGAKQHFQNMLRDNERTLSVIQVLFHTETILYSRTGIVIRVKSKWFMQICNNNTFAGRNKPKPFVRTIRFSCYFFPATQTYNLVISTILHGNI